MTTSADPNDRIIVEKVMDRIFKRDEQLNFADRRLLERFEGHAHRVMETTVTPSRTSPACRLTSPTPWPVESWPRVGLTS